MSEIETVIMKFGGSCFVNAEAFGKIKNITDIYKQTKKVYVASALNGITDMLVNVTKKADEKDPQALFDLLKNIEKRHMDIITVIFGKNPEYRNKASHHIRDRLMELQTAVMEVGEFGLQPYFSDYILSFGEKMSTYLLHLYLEKEGYTSIFYSGEDLIITDDNFTDALPDYTYTMNRVRNRITPYLENPSDDTIFCVTGFIGRNKIGYTTTLGRGGSDFTATILARAIHETCKYKSVKVILWKDVDGILTANPKLADNPQLVSKLNYAEAKELAFFGAKILHPKCLAAIEKYNIAVEIKNFSNPLEKVKYSIISAESDACSLKGISTLDKVAMITVASGALVSVPGVLGKIFTLMGDNGISVSMVAQSSSEVNTTFAVDAEDGDKAVKILNNDQYIKQWFTVSAQEVAVLAVVGCQIHNSQNKARIFNAFSKVNLEVQAIAQSSDGINISIIVPKDRLKDAVNAINQEFA
jgi:aspartate kinase